MGMFSTGGSVTPLPRPKTVLCQAHIIGWNTHDTDLTVSALGVEDALIRQLSVAVRPLHHYVPSLSISWVHLLPILII